MTSRKFMTLALATVLASNFVGLRAADASQSPANVDATLNKLATELAAAEQQAPAEPAHVDVTPAPQAQSEHAVPAAADSAAPVQDVGGSVPSAPQESAPASSTN